MRFFYVAIIWVVILGGMFWYDDYRKQLRPEFNVIQAVASEKAADFVSVEMLLTTTFSLEADPFALRLDDDASADFVAIRLNGETVQAGFSPFSRGITQSLVLENVRKGKNEIFLQLTPSFEDSDRHNGIRIQISQDARTVIDQTIWAEPGAVISELVSFTIKVPQVGDTHDH